MPSSTPRSLVATSPAAAVTGLVVAALTLAQFPGGDITGRDRGLVARITRAGVQRSETETAAAVSDPSDVHEVGRPARAAGVDSLTGDRGAGVRRPGRSGVAAPLVAPRRTATVPAPTAVLLEPPGVGATLPWPPPRARSGRAPPTV